MLAILTFAAVTVAAIAYGDRSTEADAAVYAPVCSAPDGASQQNVDSSDSAETPFRQPVPKEAIEVYFENENVSPALWEQVEEAAQIWSQSPCLRPIVVSSCPPDVNCVQVRAHSESVLDDIEDDSGPWEDSDGAFTGHEEDGIRTGGTISFNLDLFEHASPQGRLATIVHEMGHAFGLMHRSDYGVMNEVTDDDTDPRPDPTDFENLLTIYGR